MTTSTAEEPDGTVVTTSRGKLADQSALVGVLTIMLDLGFPLVSVKSVAGKAENHPASLRSE